MQALSNSGGGGAAAAIRGDQPETAAKIFRDWGEISLVEIALALLMAFALVAAIKFLVPRLARWLPDRFRFWVLPWEPILRFLVLLGALLYLTPLIIEPSAENFLAVGGALAVALGFAFKDYASSLLAGVVALYERPYRPGDWVTIDGVYGEVRRLGLRTVDILTPDDTLVSIPHLKMWSTPLHNANTGKIALMCVAEFHLDPDHDGETVVDILRDIAWTSPYLLLERPVRVVAFEKPWGTNYKLKAYPIEGRDQFQFLTDLTIRGKAALRREGIEFSAMPAIEHAGV